MAVHTSGMSGYGSHDEHPFWACMDTLKDTQAFDDMTARGDTPWEVWRSAHRSTMTVDVR
jgi:hypothetical protein